MRVLRVLVPFAKECQDFLPATKNQRETQDNKLQEETTYCEDETGRYATWYRDKEASTPATTREDAERKTGARAVQERPYTRRQPHEGKGRRAWKTRTGEASENGKTVNMVYDKHTVTVPHISPTCDGLVELDMKSTTTSDTAQLEQTIVFLQNCPMLTTLQLPSNPSLRNQNAPCPSNTECIAIKTFL